jgi:hypothetical protein
VNHGEKCSGGREAVAHARPTRHARGARADQRHGVEFRDLGRCHTRRQGVAGERKHSVADPAPHVRLNLVNDGTERREVVLVEVLALARDLPVDLTRPHLVAKRASRKRNQAATRERHRQTDHCPEDLRVSPGGAPGNRGAPVVADNDRRRFAKRVDNADEVSDEARDPVLARVPELRRAAVSALIDRDRAIAGVSERRKLMAPGVPELREAVHKKNERSASLLGDVAPDAARDDSRVSGRRHVAWVCSLGIPDASSSTVTPNRRRGVA